MNGWMGKWIQELGFGSCAHFFIYFFPTGREDNTDVSCHGANRSKVVFSEFLKDLEKKKNNPDKGGGISS